jgi:serine/threonine protein kinase
MKHFTRKHRKRMDYSQQKIIPTTVHSNKVVLKKKAKGDLNEKVSQKSCCDCEKLVINDVIYFIENIMHTSNVSKVYIAHKDCKHIEANKRVKKFIIKIYMQEYTQQAINEVSSLHILNSPRIIELIDYKIDKGVIIMPKYSHDLFDLISKCQHKNKKLSSFSIQKYFTELIDGLYYMHKNCVAHLDIKPENILLSNDHHLVYIDFGFALCLSVGVDDENNHINLSKGTPFYAAPEIEYYINGYDPYKTDVWALGITMYLLLERKRPFNMDFEKDIKKIWNSLKHEKLIFFNKNARYKEYHNMISHMLIKDPKKRWNIEQVRNENIKINKKYLCLHIDMDEESE